LKVPVCGPRSVFFVLPALECGGCERMILHFCRHMDRRKFRPTVVTFSPNVDYREELPEDVPHISLGKRRPLDIPGVLARLMRLLKEQQPDLIHTRTNFAAELVLPAWFVSRPGSKLVVAVSGPLTEVLKLERLGSVRALLTRRLYSQADRIVVISQGVRKDLVDNFGISPGQCTLIHNCVDVHRARELMNDDPGHPWLDDAHPVVLTAARLTEQKNLPMLLDAFLVVRDRCDARLIIIGKGHLEQPLIRQAEKLGIRRFVDFAGFQTNPYAFMRASTVFALSSDWEGFGNVIVEAMACGTPVVSTCVQGAEEIIQSGENGILVPPKRPDRLAEGIVRVVQDEKLRRKLSKGGLQRAEDFEVRNVTRQYEELFDDVLRQ